MMPANWNQVYAAAQLRLAELEQRRLLLDSEGLDSRPLQLALLDLHGGLEAVAQLPGGPAQATVLGYLIETYGLLSVATDPLLRGALAVIPATGATVRFRAWAINGKILLVNGKALSAAATLSPNA